MITTGLDPEFISGKIIPKRAADYALMLKDKPVRSRNLISEPASIGAVIDLGHCLNLLEQSSLDVLKRGFEILKIKMEKLGTPMPSNKNGRGNESRDLLLWFLDCAVIQSVHEFNRALNSMILFEEYFLKGMNFILVQVLRKRIISKYVLLILIVLKDTLNK
ncbi:hypothetical protein [Paenibacillus germinis]|uniref:hypothetical protein n=1 Tax=Paenibacillus germinis TaxID=2654979 RepID=UPI001C0F6AA8|nr:hypothetical protein [Paenibacillus germinis]